MEMTVLEDSTLPLIAFDQGELKDLLAKGGKIVDKVPSNFKMFGIRMVFSIPSSDFEPPL